MRVPTLLIAVFPLFVAFAQTPARLTLAEAEDLAVRHHPRISSAELTAQAAGAVPAQLKSAFFPSLFGNVTGAGADKGTAVAAGNVTTSSLASRAATGFVVSQLITDFGRTSSLVKSAELRAGAQGENAALARARVKLQVRQAYFKALLAQAVLRVARQTVEARQLTLKQVSALAKASLKSTLDVSFAEVNLSEAELALFRAENDIKAAFADLSAAMGYEEEREFDLAEEPMPDPLASDPDPLIRAALRDRPDLAGLRLTEQASNRFAQSEKRLWLPSISAIGAAGIVPGYTDNKLQGTYSGVGLNVNIPILNGGLFSARQTEAALRARAANRDVKDLEVRVARDVRVAWLNANNAFRELDVTARLVQQAKTALRLAQRRYELGLGSIVELNQAQLSETSAEIAGASAKYRYQYQRSVLDYESGALK